MSNIVLVLDTEVEPLMVTSRVGVRAHIQLEIAHLSLHYSVKVPAFKIRLKNVRLASKVQLPQEGITFNLRVHSYESSMLCVWEASFLTQCIVYIV